MDDKNYFSQIVDDFLQNEKFIIWRLLQTKELEEYWNDFRLKNPHLEKAIQEAIRQFDAVGINRYRMSKSDKDDTYKAVLHNISRHKRRKLILKLYSAAAVLLIGIVSVLFIHHINKNEESNILNEKEIIVGQALPEKEVYLISAGNKIKLTDKSHIGLTGDGKAVVTDSSNLDRELLLAKTDLNKLVVPYGKRSNLTLSDGTEVWLNSGTQLDFPSEFRGTTREIYVDGEIYIDVAHNQKIPFIVHAQDMNIFVQGTSFNISAYRDDRKKTVVLVEGKVKIETDNNYVAELIPNEKIEITNDNVSKERVDVSEYISWREGVLEFNSTPMSEILKKVGRYYNVRFDKTPDVKLNDQTFTGKLFLSNNLDSVMSSVSILSSTKYSRENDIIHISKK